MSLPQLDGPTFITDGGMETVLIFHEGLELPDFASFVLLDDEAGSEALRMYFRRFLAIGRMAPQKAPTVMLEAFRQAAAQTREISLD